MKTCLICDGEIKTKYPSQLKGRKYCSRQCADKANAKKRSDQVTLTCKICKVEFKVKRSHASKRETCSKLCWSEAHSQRLSGGNHFRWRPIKQMKKKYKWAKADDGFWNYEHRIIMERHLGRKLGRNEVVHHKNNNHLDNRLENLEVMSRAEHTRMHTEDGTYYENN